MWPDYYIILGMGKRFGAWRGKGGATIASELCERRNGPTGQGPTAGGVHTRTDSSRPGQVPRDLQVGSSTTYKYH